LGVADIGCKTFGRDLGCPDVQTTQIRHLMRTIYNYTNLKQI